MGLQRVWITTLKIILTEFHSLFSILKEVNNPTQYLAREAVAAKLLDKDCVVNEVKCFPKIEKHDSGGGSVAVSTIQQFQPRMCHVNKSVVGEFGIVPNCWLPSIFARTAGLTNISTTYSSASLDRSGVRDMGRKCLLMSKIGLFFGIGIMFASFHTEEKRPSLYEVFKISWTGFVSRSAFSLSSHPGIPSGPWALVGLMVESFLNTEAAVTINVDSEGRFESSVI